MTRGDALGITPATLRRPGRRQPPLGGQLNIITVPRTWSTWTFSPPILIGQIDSEYVMKGYQSPRGWAQTVRRDSSQSPEVTLSVGNSVQTTVARSSFPPRLSGIARQLERTTPFCSSATFRSIILMYSIVSSPFCKHILFMLHVVVHEKVCLVKSDPVVSYHSQPCRISRSSLFSTTKRISCPKTPPQKAHYDPIPERPSKFLQSALTWHAMCVCLLSSSPVGVVSSPRGMRS
jgi:hypothetical protein